MYSRSTTSSKIKNGKIYTDIGMQRTEYNYEKKCDRENSYELSRKKQHTYLTNF